MSSRQYKWAEKKKASGKCRQCGEKRNLYAQLCDVCAVKKRIYNRKYTGASSQSKSGLGRKVFIAE